MNKNKISLLILLTISPLSGAFGHWPTYDPGVQGASNAISSYNGALSEAKPAHSSYARSNREEKRYLVIWNDKSTGNLRENILPEENVNRILTQFSTDMDLMAKTRTLGGNRGLTFYSYTGHGSNEPFVAVIRLCLPNTCGVTIDGSLMGLLYIEAYDAFEMQAVIQRENLPFSVNDKRVKDLVFKTIRGEKIESRPTSLLDNIVKAKENLNTEKPTKQNTAATETKSPISVIDMDPKEELPVFGRASLNLEMPVVRGQRLKAEDFEEVN